MEISLLQSAGEFDAFFKTQLTERVLRNILLVTFYPDWFKFSSYPLAKHPPINKTIISLILSMSSINQ